MRKCFDKKKLKNVAAAEPAQPPAQDEQSREEESTPDSATSPSSSPCRPDRWGRSRASWNATSGTRRAVPSPRSTAVHQNPSHRPVDRLDLDRQISIWRLPSIHLTEPVPSYSATPRGSRVSTVSAVSAPHGLLFSGFIPNWQFYRKTPCNFQPS